MISLYNNPIGKKHKIIITEVRDEKAQTVKRNIGIFFTIAAVVVLGVLYARIISTSSRTKMLNTLSEVSSQSKGVLQKEIEKEKTILKNLAIYIGQSDILSGKALSIN